MSNESPRGTNSIFILALRTLPHLRGDWINGLTPFACSLFAFFFLYLGKCSLKMDQIVALVGNLLQFNATVLGLLLAGFGIYTVVPNNQRTLFSIVNAPKDGRFSFYKYRLLTIFKMSFWALICTGGMIFFYIVLSVKLYSGVSLLANMSRNLKVSFSIGFIVFLQVKVLVELKIYVFTIYTRSMVEARTLAQEHRVRPFDTSND